jgi:hypothetical protein
MLGMLFRLFSLIFFSSEIESIFLMKKYLNVQVQWRLVKDWSDIKGD